MLLLTNRQRKVLEFIAHQVNDRGKPPTVQEIKTKFSFRSNNAVSRHLDALERKGYLSRTGNPRGINLAEKVREDKGVPILGRVAAGTPILAIENIEGYIDLKELYGRVRGLFLLRVQGDSMIEAGIRNNDYVVVRNQPIVENGEIGVAIIDEEATVKKIFRERNRIRLQSANERKAPTYIEKDRISTEGRFRIAGKVIGIVRKFGRGWIRNRNKDRSKE